MNTFATARFVINLFFAITLPILLAVLLIKPSLVPSGTGLVLLGIGLIGVVFMFALAFAKPKDAETAYDELNKQTVNASYVWGYWFTLAVFLVFLVGSFTDVISPRTAFYYLGFPLGAVPSIYMVVAYFQGRAG